LALDVSQVTTSFARVHVVSVAVCKPSVAWPSAVVPTLPAGVNPPNLSRAMILYLYVEDPFALFLTIPVLVPPAAMLGVMVGAPGVDMVIEAPAPQIVIPSPFTKPGLVSLTFVGAASEILAVFVEIPDRGIILPNADASAQGIGPLNRLLFVHTLSASDPRTLVGGSGASDRPLDAASCPHEAGTPNAETVNKTNAIAFFIGLAPR